MEMYREFSLVINSTFKEEIRCLGYISYILVCGVIMTYITPSGHFVSSSTVLQNLECADCASAIAALADWCNLALPHLGWLGGRGFPSFLVILSQSGGLF